MRPTTAYITSSYGPRYLTTFIIQRNVSLDQVASGSARSVPVIDGYLFILLFLLCQMQCLYIHNKLIADNVMPPTLFDKDLLYKNVRLLRQT